MTPLQLYDLFRADIVDVATPYLWSDDEAWGYMDEAQKQFARLTGGLSDASSALTSIELAAGDVWVNIDPRILKIRHIKKSTNDADVPIHNFEDMELTGRDNDYGIRRIFRLNDEEGPLQYLIAGMERDKLRCVPIPTVDETLSLIVYRIPLTTLTVDTGATAEFEIEEQHHRPLLFWMKKLAYDKQDAETFDRSKASEFEKKFLEYCSVAKHERELREHKYRAVVYGGL